MSDDQLLDYDQYVSLLLSRDGQPIARAALLSGGKPAIAALIRGMSHPNPKMRVWCTGLLDHMEAEWDANCVQAVLERLEDDVPRVRSHALHALSCQICHPTLPDLDVVAPLLKLAVNDPSIRVRRSAVRHLALLPYDSRIAETLGDRLNQETDDILLNRLKYALRVHSDPDSASQSAVS
jgi:hypothetical protein